MKKDKTSLHIIIAIAIFAVMKLFIQPTNGLTDIGVSVLSLFAATIYLWITVSTGWPSLMLVLGFMLIGVKTPNEIWAASWGSWLIPFLVFCFMFSIALSETGVMRRIITWFITRKFVEKKPWAFITMLLVGEYVVGLFMDCTAESVFVLPLLLELYAMLGYNKDEKLPKMLLIGSISATILSTLATPIGHVIPIMYMGVAYSGHGVAVSMMQYTACAFPACTAAFIIMLLYFRFIVKPDVSKLANYNIEMAKESLPPKTNQERFVSAGYFLAIFFWILPDILKGIGILLPVANWISGLGFAVAPGVALVALCMVKVDGKPVMNFANLLSKVSWSTIILVTSMNTLNACVTAPSTGVALWLTSAMKPIIAGSSSGMFVVALALIWVIIQTNFMSCFATAQMVYSAIVPIVVAFPALGVSPAALTLAIGMSCGYGALLPPASGPPSVLLSTEWCTPSDSIKITPPLIIVFIVTSIFIAYPLFEAMF